jgi:hypothetical protein
VLVTFYNFSRNLGQVDSYTTYMRDNSINEASGAVTGDPEVVRQDTRGHAWALAVSPDGNIWGATVNRTAGDAEKLDDVVFPLFPQGGGFPRSNADVTLRRIGPDVT